MTADDDMPWSAPWTVPRGAKDEAAFVEDVSGALYVPNAAPEIRMFAEVMAVLDIPAQPQRVSTVNRRIAEERARREAAANAVPLRRLPSARGIAAAAVAAAIAIGLATVSAYAGVLPDSIQKMAHSVINAPEPKHDHDVPGSGSSTSGNHGGGNSGNSGNGTSQSGSAAPGNSAGADPTTSTTPAATRTGAPASASSPSSSHTNTPNPHSTSSPAPVGGNGHKTKTPAPTPSGSTNSGSTNQHHG